MKSAGLVFITMLFLVACQSSQQPPGQTQNRPPTAMFTASTNHGKAPLAVSFDASGSTDPDGTIASYTWSFGDGQTTSGVTANHTFTRAGAFTVRLTVTDNRGATGSTERAITVTDADGNVPPRASFTATPATGIAPLAVTFNATASSDTDGSITSYSWNFGDGNTGSGATIIHTYAAPGSYSVTLTVMDNSGATDTAQTTVVVQASDSPSADTQVITSSHQIAEQAPWLPDEVIGQAVDVVLLATQLANSNILVSTGTVTQTGSNSFSYDPSPTNRLRFVLSSGAEFEMVVSTLNGDFSGDGGRFLHNPHQAALQISSNAQAGAIQLEVQSVKANGQFEQMVQGEIPDESGNRWNLNVQRAGTYFASADSVTNETSHTAQGTIQSPALGVSMTLNKFYRYKMVNVIENIEHQINHSWTHNGNQYQFQDVRVRVAFREAQPTDRDFWIIQGALLRNGTAIGQVTPEEDPTGLTIWLDLSLERVQMFRFSYL